MAQLPPSRNASYVGMSPFTSCARTVCSARPPALSPLVPMTSGTGRELSLAEERPVRTATHRSRSHRRPSSRGSRTPQTST
eukprot:1814288-Pleurochrysis_carterae.AAC.2